ncbi:MAG: hypothetical protein K0Q85_1159 [Caproiciproducens sp.]|nr:hypothetical protein [Caproiciproducens sp.]
MKNRNWFWGFFFLLSAIFVIASQTGSFGQIGLMSLLATVLLAALAIHSAVNRNFFGIFLPLAFLYMIYWQPLKLIEISFWLLILAAVLTSIGFSILFRSHPPKMMDWHGGMQHSNQTSENIDDNNPYTKVSFGSSSKYLHSDSLKSGQFIASFGALEVFFDQAQLSPEGAEIFIDCSFSGVELYVPKHWQVLDNMHASLGAVNNDVRLAHPQENAPKLIITGNVQFGAVDIKYI